MALEKKAEPESETEYKIKVRARPRLGAYRDSTLAPGVFTFSSYAVTRGAASSASRRIGRERLLYFPILWVNHCNESHLYYNYPYLCLSLCVAYLGSLQTEF